MANQIDERVKPFEVKMGKSIASLDSEFGTIRAGRTYACHCHGSHAAVDYAIRTGEGAEAGDDIPEP